MSQNNWSKVSEPEELFSKGFSQVRKNLPPPRPSTINFEDEKEVENMLDELENDMELEDLETRPYLSIVALSKQVSIRKQIASQVSIDDEIDDLIKMKAFAQGPEVKKSARSSQRAISQNFDIEELEAEFFSSLDDTKLKMISQAEKVFPSDQLKTCLPIHIEKHIEQHIKTTNSGFKPLLDRRSAKPKDDPDSLSQQLKKLSQELEEFEAKIEEKPTADFGALFKKRRKPTSKKKRKSSRPAVLDNPPTAKLYKTRVPQNLGTGSKCEVDREQCQTWVYLLYRQFRRYQFEITETCLFSNTLVCLPTGMGKTFIAANIIYNYYRWFPTGKIFFLAATRPLVTQQIKCVEEIDGIDFNDATELTGGLAHSDRAERYAQKRIFFQTPQTLQNDLERGIVDLNMIVLVIYGRLKGNLRRSTQGFR